MFAGRKKAKAKEVPAWKLQLEAAEAVAPVAQDECDATAATSSSGGARDDGNSVDSIGAKRRRDDAVLRSESVEEEASRRDQRDCGRVDRPCSQSPASPSPSSPPSSQSPSPCPSATSAREQSPDSETRVSAAESGAVRPSAALATSTRDQHAHATDASAPALVSVGDRQELRDVTDGRVLCAARRAPMPLSTPTVTCSAIDDHAKPTC